MEAGQLGSTQKVGLFPWCLMSPSSYLDKFKAKTMEITKKVRRSERMILIEYSSLLQSWFGTHTSLHLRLCHPSLCQLRGFGHPGSASSRRCHRIYRWYATMFEKFSRIFELARGNIMFFCVCFLLRWDTKQRSEEGCCNISGWFIRHWGSSHCSSLWRQGGAHLF